jgi:hypothetical protein
MRIGHRLATSTALAAAIPGGARLPVAEDVMLAGSAGRLARDGEY